MGQIQSDIDHKEEEHDDHVGDDNRKNSADTPYSSMDALIAEATAMGGDESEGSDCVSPFIALQKCIQENKDAFAKYDLDDNDTEDGENAQEDKGSAVLSSDAGEHKISP